MAVVLAAGGYLKIKEVNTQMLIKYCLARGNVSYDCFVALVLLLVLIFSKESWRITIAFTYKHRLLCWCLYRVFRVDFDFKPKLK